MIPHSILRSAFLLAFFCLYSAAWRAEEGKVIRVGIIGTDTSHVPAFTKLLNKPDNTGDLAGIRVVAAYPGGSPDVESSHTRVQKFAADISKMGVEIVDSIDALLPKVDAVLLESVDGRPHLAQVRPVIQAKKPVFIDKPVAGSFADAVEIYRLAREAGVPLFSSSSLRYGKETQALKSNAKLGGILGCEVHSPCSLEPHDPDLFWYGVHGVEMLFTIMGTGCESVSRTHAAGTDVVVGKWKDGRISSYRGIREGAAPYGATVFGKKAIVPVNGYSGYEPLVVEIARFFKTGKPPVSERETLEIFAFMEAADESKRRGGASVRIEVVLAKARAVHKAAATR